MSDESIINLCDESKSAMRNYVMAAGLVALFVFSLIVADINIRGYTTYEFLRANNIIFASIFFVVLLSLGIILALLHKRDLVSITFILLAMSIFLPQFGAYFFGGFTGYAMIAIVLISGIMFLFTRNEQRIACSTLLILRGLMFGSALMPSYSHEFVAVLSIIMAIVCAYFAIVIVLGNLKLPLYSMLTVDETDSSKDGSPVHFSVTGSILGYMLFSAAMLSSVLFYCGVDDVSIKACYATEAVCGLMLIVTGFIMLVAGRMKFTSMLFIMIGIVTSTTMMIMGTSHICFLFYLLIAIFCFFKEDRRILVGLAVLIYGLTYPISASVGGDIFALSVVLNLAPFLILMYVCLALCSDGRLKLI